MNNIFLAFFLFEPLIDFVFRLTGFNDFEPITAGTVYSGGGDNLHNITVLKLIVERNDFAVHARAVHFVADSAVNVKRKVNGRCAGRKAYNVAFGRKYKNLVGEKVKF